MSGSRTAIADTNPLGGIASLINVAAPLFLGSGTKTGSGTTTNKADPALLAILQGIVTQAQTNANDPKATESLVNDIMRKAAVAFTPVIGQSARSGLYNNSLLDQLAREQTANTTAAASKAVLDYKTSQQAIAANGAAQLINATGSRTTTETSGTGAIFGSNGGSILGLGLAGLQAYSQRDKLLKWLGLGGDSTTGGADLPLPIPPDFISESGAAALNGVPQAESIGGIPLPPAFIPESYAGGAEAASDAGGLLDLASGGGGADNVTDIGGIDFGAIIGDAASGIGDFLSGIGNSASSVFDDILSLFSF